MSKSIEEGDIVDIYWERCTAVFNAKVTHVPVATGDTWAFETEDGKALRSSYFAQMICQVPAPPDENGG